MRRATYSEPDPDASDSYRSGDTYSVESNIGEADMDNQESNLNIEAEDKD